MTEAQHNRNEAIVEALRRHEFLIAERVALNGKIRESRAHVRDLLGETPTRRSRPARESRNGLSNLTAGNVADPAHGCNPFVGIGGARARVQADAAGIRLDWEGGARWPN